MAQRKTAPKKAIKKNDTNSPQQEIAKLKMQLEIRDDEVDTLIGELQSFKNNERPLYSTLNLPPVPVITGPFQVPGTRPLARSIDILLFIAAAALAVTSVRRMVHSY